jgi:hypothetical protein
MGIVNDSFCCSVIVASSFAYPRNVHARLESTYSCCPSYIVGIRSNPAAQQQVQRNESPEPSDNNQVNILQFTMICPLFSYKLFHLERITLPTHPMAKHRAIT